MQVAQEREPAPAISPKREWHPIEQPNAARHGQCDVALRIARLGLVALIRLRHLRGVEFGDDLVAVDPGDPTQNVCQLRVVVQHQRTGEVRQLERAEHAPLRARAEQFLAFEAHACDLLEARP